MRSCEYMLTDKGRRKVAQYVRELEAKRKEILDAGKDTADDTVLPTVEDIVADINWNGVDEDGEYLNGWGVTDNYDSDYALCLRLGEDFIESCGDIKASTRKSTKYPQGYVKASSYDDSVTKYYIYVGDERYNDSGYDDFEDALTEAESLIASGSVSGHIEIEETTWYSYDSYNNYEPADEFRVVWKKRV